VGVIKPGTVIQRLVALLKYRSYSTAVNSPTGMVVDLCLCARRPDKNLQREGMVLAFVLAGHVPVSLCAPRLFKERANLSLERGGVLYRVLYKISQAGSGSP